MPEARHDFDRTIPASDDPHLETARGCDLERNIDTGFDRRLDTGELVIGPAMRRAYEDGCRGRGGHRAGNAAASAAAEQAIERFLRKVFRLAR